MTMRPPFGMISKTSVAVSPTMSSFLAPKKHRKLPLQTFKDRKKIISRYACSHGVSIVNKSYFLSFVGFQLSSFKYKIIVSFLSSIPGCSSHRRRCEDSPFSRSSGVSLSNQRYPIKDTNLKLYILIYVFESIVFTDVVCNWLRYHRSKPVDLRTAPLDTVGHSHEVLQAHREQNVHIEVHTLSPGREL